MKESLKSCLQRQKPLKHAETASQFQTQGLRVYWQIVHFFFLPKLVFREMLNLTGAIVFPSPNGKALPCTTLVW